MNRLVIFLNELSCLVETNPTPERLLACVLLMVSTLKATRRLRRDLLIASQSPITNIPLGNGTQYLRTILNGNLHKEEWRFLQILEQLSPWGAYPGTIPPGDSTGVSFGGKAAIGMGWATENQTAVFSFGHPPNWNLEFIPAQFDKINNAGDVERAPIRIPNLSAPTHVETHIDLIREFGVEVSPSSLVYTTTGFDIRMYFREHNPPHFHIHLPGRVTGKCDIDTLDFTVGEIPPSVQRRIREWAMRHRSTLRENWVRCQRGMHPRLIVDGV